ncbi:MAG: ATP synthase F1 subunit gamma [Endomicrobium sp.]|jgi:F-type H+-transporting ATPase subunit gamma|nr:ATP synthase F1 subunit gamma [Endomicrobium sp.]
MAQNLQQLKKRIKTSDSIFKIAKAMEMVSTSKIRKAQSSVDKYNPYAEKIRRILQRIVANKDLLNKMEKFAKEIEGKRLVYIICPDRGFVGGLIVNLFKKANSYLNPSDYVIAVGKKALADATWYNHNVIASFDMGTNFPKHDDLYPMIDIAKQFYLSGEVVKISVIYAKFKNILVQDPVVEEIFPVKQDGVLSETEIEYIFEPSSQQVLKDLFPFYFEIEFYNALVNAYASEQAARMIAMKKAKDNANDISETLTSIYNKSRQERITNEILDLANGRQGI